MSPITEQDRQRVAERLAPLAAMFPNWKPTPQTIEAYVVVLADVDPFLLEAAIFELLSRPLEFMPVAGKIRQVAFDLGAPAIPDPYEAWSEVLGYFRGQTDVHPMVDRAVALLGGWKLLGQSENQVADRARFLECYRMATEKSEDSRRALPQVKQLVAHLGRRKELPG